VVKVAAVLAQAAKAIAAGKLKPTDRGKWCRVRDDIEYRMGKFESVAYELREKVWGYEAAIAQVTHSRGDPILIYDRSDAVLAQRKHRAKEEGVDETRRY
jgi:hypothetical protein